MIAVTARCVDRFLISWLIFKYMGLYAWGSQGPAARKRLEVLCRGRHPLARRWKGAVHPPNHMPATATALTAAAGPAVPAHIPGLP